MKLKDWQKYLLALAAVVIIFAIPFLLNPNAKFGGADDAGSKAIQAQQPGFVRWAAPWWTPPPETESMLFALQAAIGALIIGYFIGYEKARRDFSKNKKNQKETGKKNSDEE